MRSARRVVSPLKHLLIRRRFHAYGVGTARSGTKSLARIFQAQYRAAHEPRAIELIEMLLQYAEGHVQKSAMARFVRRRDRRLWLEFESNQLVASILDVVVPRYPDSRFILTVRHPLNWLESLINHEIRAEENPVWTRWSVKVFGDRTDYAPSESELKERGLFSVRGYLRQWARHNQHVLDTVPEDRLLVLPTPSISSSLESIADFLGIPLETLDTEQSHANLGADKIPLYSVVDREYVLEQVEGICGDVMRRLHLDGGYDRGAYAPGGVHA